VRFLSEVHPKVFEGGDLTLSEPSKIKSPSQMSYSPKVLSLGSFRIDLMCGEFGVIVDDLDEDLIRW
jgi:hypothetical protein